MEMEWWRGEGWSSGVGGGVGGVGEGVGGVGGGVEGGREE